MRFERVTAYAFGPLTDRTLELAPGLNVIWGPNEAGKSTWHAALFAGLCGMRRVRGKPTSEDQQFIDRHRPWDGHPWEVGATIRLEDGRRIELRHDLAGRVSSRATDADLGRDCSDEIIAEGSPDGSRWLGLDRRSFVATACVRQADLLGVMGGASLLQEHVQRAAATGGTDATAAAALARLERFRAERVGRNAANSTRPLRRSVVAVDDARRELARAREEHTRFLELAAAIEARQQLIDDLTGRLRHAQIDEVRTELNVLEGRVEAANELARRFPAGPPSVDATQHRLALDAQKTLEAWRRLPGEQASKGPSVEELKAQLIEQERMTTETAPAARSSRAVLGAGLIAILAGVAAYAAGLGALGLLIAAVGIVLLGWTFGRASRSPLHTATSPPHDSARDALLVQIARREQEEAEAAIALEQRERVSTELRALANRCQLEGDTDSDLARALESLVEGVHRHIGNVGQDAQAYAELVAIRGQATIDELEGQLVETRTRFQELNNLLEPGYIGEPSGEQGDVNDIQRQAAEEAQMLARLQGQQAELQQTLPSVAEMEERCLAAEVELARLQRLDQILVTTQQFLDTAQERVHRTIAPVLAEAVRDRLSRITANRYQDVRVDPATLEVRVQDAAGNWREAALLSHGTAEQIYLLLRVALAEQLTTRGEVCPLILDDVTAHCDHERTQAVLETLLEISQERQVILFSQERQVHEWAERRLRDERDSLISLASQVPATSSRPVA